MRVFLNIAKAFDFRIYSKHPNKEMLGIYVNNVNVLSAVVAIQSNNIEQI